MALDVLVAGAAGTLGRQVTAELLSRGHRVRALIHRTPLPDDLAEQVDARRADALVPRGLDGVCDGIDVVFSSLGASVDPTTFAGLRGFQGVDTPANLNLLDCARRARCRRFVYVAVAGHESLGHLRYISAHEGVVGELRKGPLSYAILRPTGFFAAFAEFLAMVRKGPVTIIGDGSARTNPIHEGDVAAACLEALEGEDGERSLGGPEILTRRRIVELAFEALDEPVRIRSMPSSLARGLATLIRPLHPRLGDFGRFAADVFSQDLLAPVYGQRRLGDYFAEIMRTDDR